VVDGSLRAGKPRRVSVLILNAGLAGREGNSHVIAEHAAAQLQRRSVPHELVVLKGSRAGEVAAALERAERLVFVSGTYWGGFSSLLQQLFEELTASEGGALWLGKPAAVLVSAHQVGAQSVLWRLQGLLVAFGCAIPPMSGVVISKVGEQLRLQAPELCRDVWGLADIETALHNLLASGTRGDFRAWPVDAEHFAERWLEPEHDAP
jgi:NAD(P)H-dependent FMN reductase